MTLPCASGCQAPFLIFGSKYGPGTPRVPVGLAENKVALAHYRSMSQEFEKEAGFLGSHRKGDGLVKKNTRP